MELGEKIEKYCADEGIYLPDFAKMIGVTPIGLQRIMDGVRMPNMVALKNMAKLMGVSPEALLDDGSKDGKMKASKALRELIHLRDGVDVEEPEGVITYKAVQEGIDALKKQVPIRAKYNQDIGAIECPVCGSVSNADPKRTHYCFNCGQAFDWITP